MVPLVVDVDGTLLRTDLLHEGLWLVLRRSPWRLPVVFGSLPRGRAAFKVAVADAAIAAGLDVGELPRNPHVTALIEQALDGGRPVHLASGADARHVHVLGTRLRASRVTATTDAFNCTGARKLGAVQAHTPRFDYVGNARADLPLWRAARTPYGAGMSRGVHRAALAARPDLVALEAPVSAWRAIPRALRLHQWAKNLLLFVPGIAAHLAWTAAEVRAVVLGFLAFGLTASGLYVFNDLLDLPHDRAHPTKRLRPLASGALPLAYGPPLSALCLAGGVAIASQLPRAFAVLLALYALLSLTYSLVLKNRLLLDVLALAALFCLRVASGAVLVPAPLSRWFLAFALFSFFSLAVLKRVIELRRSAPVVGIELAGRRYRPEDLPVLTNLGVSSAAGALLIYCLYITSLNVRLHYREPILLWLGLPLLLYFFARLWIFVGRGALDDDPVQFALRDRISYALVAAFLVVVYAATHVGPIAGSWILSE